MRFGDKSTWSSPYEALAGPGETICHPRLGVFAETLRDRFDIEIHSFEHDLEIFSLTVEQRATGKVSHLGNVTGSCHLHPFVLIICSACFREVSVNFAPLNIRATSSVRSSPLTARMLVRKRPAESFFSIT